MISLSLSLRFMLAFAESYDPLWVARVDKANGTSAESIHSIPLYSVINGFYVNQTGSLDITIEYEPRKRFMISYKFQLSNSIAMPRKYSYKIL